MQNLSAMNALPADNNVLAADLVSRCLLSCREVSILSFQLVGQTHHWWPTLISDAGLLLVHSM